MKVFDTNCTFEATRQHFSSYSGSLGETQTQDEHQELNNNTVSAIE